MEVVTLNNGVIMPQVGLGTFDLPKDKIPEIIECAYDLGYRKFDTATKYKNESELGKAFQALNVPRNKLFIQTKIDIPDFYYGTYRYNRGRFLNIRKRISVRESVFSSLERLKTDYIDMLLIHWPCAQFSKFYNEIEFLCSEGLIRAIGVCSFLPPHIEYLAEKCSIPPALNQFEISPLNTQKEVISYCLTRGIQPEAMATFSHFRSSEPRMEIINNSVVCEIAEKLERTPVQIINRWLVQQGLTIVPKSKNPIHLAENINLFDFTLSDEDMRTIDSLDKGKFLNYNPTTASYSVPKRLRSSKWFM